MRPHEPTDQTPLRPECCHCCGPGREPGGISRRAFLGGMGGAALAGAAAGGLSWAMLSAAETQAASLPARRPLVVKPILTHTVYVPRPKSSWRTWGGIQTQAEADQEAARIKGELKKLEAAADFPVRFLPVAAMRNVSELSAAQDDLAAADAVLLYPSERACAVDVIGALDKLGKDVILFARYQSGPVYYGYVGMSARYLRQRTDKLARRHIDFDDGAIDNLDEVLWRLRALCGLRNTIGSRIVAVGGPGGWSQPAGSLAELARERLGLDIRTVDYKELGELISQARQDQAAVRRANQRAAQYLQLPGTTLETERHFVEKAFLLEEIFRKLMARAECRAITVNECMSTIIPMSETTACLPLSTLNDDDYLAFCESDFAPIPAGILLANISGRPPFLQNPTFPHDGFITLAHCTAPRKMDGKTLEPARIMTHYESDYGAAPKVDMHIGQEVTMVAADFAMERWLGLSGEIIAHPFAPICRSQIDVRLRADCNLVRRRTPGFHWMLVYGDYLREVGYAMRRLPIEWDCLG